MNSLRAGVRGRVGVVVALSAVLSVALSASPVRAQDPPVRARGRVQGAQGAERAPDGDRVAMERRLQQRMSAIVRQRLGLNDEQFNQLRAATARFEGDRRLLRRDEIAARSALRRELTTTESVNEGRVAELLEQLPKLERRRIDLMENEQRELAKFLSPSQRARYAALQDELRRGLQDLQRRRNGGEPGPPPGVPLRRPPG